MPAGNIWAWPSAVVSPEDSLKAMIEFLKEAVEIANICPEVAHPIDLMYHISAEYHFMAKKLSKRLGLAEEIPELAQLVASSPLDAANSRRLRSCESYQQLQWSFCRIHEP